MTIMDPAVVLVLKYLVIYTRIHALFQLHQPYMSQLYDRIVELENTVKIIMDKLKVDANDLGISK
jgi:hypothetical protein